MEPTLYLRKISIKNIRCFENVSLDLMNKSGSKPNMWAIVLGDNGVGKTTFLRCIAMGLTDRDSAAGLIREIYGNWNRCTEETPAKGEIKLEFFDPDSNETATITTTINPTISGYSQVHQKIKFRNQKEFPWDRIFVCGYGSARRGFGSQDVEEYAAIDSVYTLFNYDTSLQNPELVLRRIKDTGITIQPILDSLSQVLMLDPGSVELDGTGLVIRGAWGNFQARGAIGDGYQATLAWISDLLGWALLYDSDVLPTEIAGIVLIDELEQHLHPAWQRKIIGLLRRQFPRLQFIATTHTPMCAIGTTELDDDECELLVLEREGNSVRIVENYSPPRGLSANEILTSPLFQLPTARDDQTLEAIQTFAHLRAIPPDQLTEAKQTQLRTLTAQLESKLGKTGSDFEERVREAVMRVLREEGAVSEDDQALNFETIRQIREILER